MLRFEIKDQKVVSFRSTEEARLSEDCRALFTDEATIKLTVPSGTVLHEQKLLPLVTVYIGDCSWSMALKDGFYYLTGHGKEAQLFQGGIPQYAYQSALGIDLIWPLNVNDLYDMATCLLQLTVDEQDLVIFLPDIIAQSLQPCHQNGMSKEGFGRLYLMYKSDIPIDWFVEAETRPFEHEHVREITLRTHRTDYRSLGAKLADYLLEHGIETFRDEPQVVEKCQIT